MKDIYRKIQKRERKDMNEISQENIEREKCKEKILIKNLRETEIKIINFFNLS